MTATFERVVQKYSDRYSRYYNGSRGANFALGAPDGARHTFGHGEPAFTLTAADERGLQTLDSLDQLLIAESYLHGHLDVEGDMETLLTHRNFFPDLHPVLRAWRFIKPRISGQVQSDQGWISHHYDIDADFFLTFLDTRHRCYSQGVYEHDDESLEAAITRKLDFAMEAIRAKPGDRVLDVGGGWGAFTEYAGCRGVQVTSLTISRESEKFLNELIRRERIPCTARYEHLYEHSPAEPYDAIVVLGVTEHLPDYDKSLTKYQSLLRPGGRVYLDASAKRKKFEVSAFLQKHIYPGNGSPMCLHDYLRAVAASRFMLEGVWDDRHSYALTAREWALRLDARRDEVKRRWGKAQYRKFRLFLWGCADGFARDDLQAYRVVLELRENSSRRFRGNVTAGA
ncbi:MAG TPA: class I SAM-dependent methyltransferase [Gemmatimonadaceae bacterium]|nr:class I SAM-dependent methyltransferase [Gemmatimonadaceae bacterium]